MELFLETDKQRFAEKTASYSEFFMPYVEHMKIIVDKHPDVSEYQVFNDYINIVQWPIRKLEYAYVFNQIIKNVDESSNILDAGCGVTPLPFLLGTYSKNVFAVDFSSEDIGLMQRIKERNDFPGSSNVFFGTQNICKLNFPDQYFDVISCVSVLEHIDFPYFIDALSELYRVLKPGGTLVCTMDFWLGASRATTLREGGFTKEDIRELLDVFEGQVSAEGTQSLDNVKKADIDRFWSAHHDPELKFSIREYVAVGFAVKKHLDSSQYEETVQRLQLYKNNKYFTALVARNELIAEIEADRAARWDVIAKLSKDIETLQADREARLQSIYKLQQDGDARLAAMNQLHGDSEARLDVINRQHAELERLTERLAIELTEKERVITEQQSTMNNMHETIKQLQENLNKYKDDKLIKLIAKWRLPNGK